MRKKIVLFGVFFILLSCFAGRFDITTGGFEVNVAYAATEADEIEKELKEQVSKQLTNLDFDDIEVVLSSLSADAKDLFRSTSFVDKVNYVISGKYADESGGIFSSILSIFWRDLKKCLPLISIIISVSILGGMISALKPTC